jgi:hypothetical protein
MELLIMVLNIIHKSERIDRMGALSKELVTQEINDYRFWEGIHGRTTYEGINLAHKQIIRYAKERELSKILIAEDDIKFSDAGAFGYFLQNEPEDYDIYLGGIFLGHINNGIALRFTGMTLYMVHERFYDAFLKTPDDMHIDHALAEVGGRYVVCDPFVVTQHNGKSDNTGRHENYDFIFENRKLYKKV